MGHCDKCAITCFAGGFLTSMGIYILHISNSDIAIGIEIVSLFSIHLGIVLIWIGISAYLITRRKTISLTIYECLQAIILMITSGIIIATATIIGYVIDMQQPWYLIKYAGLSFLLWSIIYISLAVVPIIKQGDK